MSILVKHLFDFHKVNFLKSPLLKKYFKRIACLIFYVLQRNVIADRRYNDQFYFVVNRACCHRYPRSVGNTT